METLLRRIVSTLRLWLGLDGWNAGELVPVPVPAPMPMSARSRRRR